MPSKHLFKTSENFGMNVTIVVFSIDMHQRLCKEEDMARANCAKTVQEKEQKNKQTWTS